MAFRLLKTHHSHSSDKFNHSTKANRFLNDLLERGHNKSKAFDVFREEELKLIKMNKRRKRNKSMTCKSSLEEALEARVT